MGLHKAGFLGDGVDGDVHIFLLHAVRQAAIAHPVLAAAAVAHGLSVVHRQITRQGTQKHLVLIRIISGKIGLGGTHGVVGRLVSINIGSLNGLAIGRRPQPGRNCAQGLCNRQRPQVYQFEIVQKFIAEELIYLQIADGIVDDLCIGKSLHAHLHHHLSHFFTHKTVLYQFGEGNAVAGFDDLHLGWIVQDGLHHFRHTVQRLSVHLRLVHSAETDEEITGVCVVVLAIIQHQINVGAQAVAGVVAGFVVHIHSAAGRKEGILGIALGIGVAVGLSGDVQPDDIHHHFHFVHHILVLCTGKLDEIGHGGDVFGIVVIRVVLVKAVVIALLHPGIDALFGQGDVGFAGVAIGKNGIGPGAACQVFRHRKEDLVIFAPMAHTVGTAIILIHPVFKARKAALDLILIFLLQTMLVFQIEANEGVGGKIGTILPHIDALDGAFQIGGNLGCIGKISILQKFRFIEHLVEFVVTALGQHRFIRLDKQKLISKLQHDAAKKQRQHKND